MKEFVITKNDEGQRLDKYIARILKNASTSFAYKMLRKKNIVLNDAKASGSERLVGGDTVKFYLSDETFERFSKRSSQKTDLAYLMPPVIYEDDDIIIACKPSGMLSQKSKPGDVSFNEICLSYLKKNGKIDEKSLKTFTPGVCNRLDRNTSGLIAFAVNYKSANILAGSFRAHSIGKFYKCIVAGKVTDDLDLTASLVKNERTNKVTVSLPSDKGRSIRTKVHPLTTAGDISLLEVELVTGKTHQIRAHLASIGHPIIGDEKYGDKKINAFYRKDHGITSQMLACTKMVFPADLGLSGISGMTVETDVPDDFNKVMLCQPGIQGV